ncbi:MAG: alpha/beta fold hydrolase [Rhodanobacter sp.]
MTEPKPFVRPLWQRLLLRRLKFLAWLLALLVVGVGGSYLLAPQWLVQAGLARQALASHVQKQSVRVGDIDWSYYEGGEGPTIVLLHGFGLDKSAWLDVARLLTPHFHVLIPDLPGWGDTPATGERSMLAQASALDGFMRATGVRAAVVVGHGTGGAVAAVYAAEYPARVRELALLDAYGLDTTHSAFDSPTAAARAFVYDDRSELQRADALLWAKPPVLRGRLQDVRIARNRRDRAFIESALERLRQRPEQRVVQDRLARLSMPVLGLWCHDDPVIDRSALDSLRNGLVNASAISTSVISGCHHLPMLEQPDATAQILTGFALSH